MAQTTQAEADEAEPVRTPLWSATEMSELVLPQHANAGGTAFGGTILSWIDICAAITAHRHCGYVAVTAAIDDLEFLAPIRIGDIVRISGCVNAAFRTSMEVQVLVEREHAASRKRTPCVDAFTTFVAIDAQGKPRGVPPLVLENVEDRQRADAAQARRKERLKRKRAARSQGAQP